MGKLYAMLGDDKENFKVRKFLTFKYVSEIILVGVLLLQGYIEISIKYHILLTILIFTIFIGTHIIRKYKYKIEPYKENSIYHFIMTLLIILEFLNQDLFILLWYILFVCREIVILKNIFKKTQYKQ